MTNGNGKTVVGVINEAKDELKDFLETRLQMLMGEMKRKFWVWRLALPMFLMAATIGFLGFVLLSFALVAAIAHAMARAGRRWWWASFIP